MKKGKNAGVRIKRCVKELKEINTRSDIGNLLFEEIIAYGIHAKMNELEKRNNKKNWIFPKGYYVEISEVLRKHLKISENDI